jgi:hypothetical protein
MQPAALGVRMHSGWGALVAVTKSAGVEVIDRRRLELTAPGTAGARQPYHFAESLELPEAEAFLAHCFAASKHLGTTAIRNLLNELRERQYRVVGCAVLKASGRPLPPLASILASHPLIHTAEGEFFRDIVAKACGELGLAVTAVRERQLDECVQRAFGAAAARIRRQVASLGRTLGPPWTLDQKTAALAALLALENTPTARSE